MPVCSFQCQFIYSMCIFPVHMFLSKRCLFTWFLFSPRAISSNHRSNTIRSWGHSQAMSALPHLWHSELKLDFVESINTLSPFRPLHSLTCSDMSTSSWWLKLAHVGDWSIYPAFYLQYSCSHTASLYGRHDLLSVCASVLHAEKELQQHHAICRENGGETIDFMEKRKLITDVWICHPRRASKGNGQCYHQQRGLRGGAHTHKHAQTHRGGEEARHTDTKRNKTKRPRETNRPWRRHAICLKYKLASTEPWQMTLWMPIRFRGISWFYVSQRQHHNNSIFGSTVDILTIIDTHAVQLELKQVSDGDRWCTKGVTMS